ncbi:MAG: virulence RhuM family protein [Clostridia bacterium]|nr:virulence RhuM family protein [Clostridia bacterium]
MDNKDLYIRSSAEEFLVFKLQEKDKGIQVRYENENLWMTQKAMAELFDVEQPAIAKHLINIYNEQELDKNSTYSKMELVQKEGKRNVKRNVEFYNLDAIISVGYRINSLRATQFRRWATQVLKKFTIQGYVLDKERMKNGSFIDEDYFEKLLEEIREIRLSERRFYQKVTDLYATAIDYDKKSPITIDFFKKVQNKMHYAVTHQTAAEIIYNRVDSTKHHMNLTTWKNSPDGKIMESDVVVAKNYLTKDEIEDLEGIVSAFLELAERRAKRHIPMTMEDWANRIDKYLLADDRDVLKDAGKISHEIAEEKALTEFEKYRVIQDRLYQSDFDKLIQESNNKN